jgi:hypothetical protein
VAGLQEAAGGRPPGGSWWQASRRQLVAGLQEAAASAQHFSRAETLWLSLTTLCTGLLRHQQEASTPWLLLVLTN